MIGKAPPGALRLTAQLKNQHISWQLAKLVPWRGLPRQSAQGIGWSGILAYLSANPSSSFQIHESSEAAV